MECATYGSTWDSIDIRAYSPVIDWKTANGQNSYLDTFDVNSYRSVIDWDEGRQQSINMDHLDIRKSQVLIIQMAEKAPLKPKRHVPRMYDATDNVLTNGGSDMQRESLKKQASTVEENHMDDSKTRIRQSDDQDRCTICLRNVLHCYNVFILILGCGALAVGIWYLVTEYSAREVSVVVGEEWFEVATYLLIGAGGTIALLAFCGCCGTMREDKCVLGFYSGTLSFMLLFLTVSCGMAFYFRRQVTKDIVKHMTNTIEQQYGLDTRTNSNNKLVTDAWDSLQRQLQCCGIKGGENSSFSWSVYKLRSEWYRRNPEQSPYVPRSCCKKDSNEKRCTGEIRMRAPPALGPPIGKNDQRNDDLNTEGCLDKIREHLIKRAIILGLVAGSIPILLAVGIWCPVVCVSEFGKIQKRMRLIYNSRSLLLTHLPLTLNSLKAKAEKNMSTKSYIESRFL
ncbi:tetraspanin-18 isoform X2 [Octopus sinensis]|uniref:Tetraspanin-18 isoform X2 n=1 Tax=Octopus sinensis TaxID=2607531 RepID=A0A7E6F0D5_9MOLL|nr:tetraspanin-18 isoform X2 [Octopus sinensis]